MKTNHTIDYFNAVSNEIFEVLADIKYSVRYFEISQEKMFIGFSIDTEYFAAQITILTPDNPRYKRDKMCNMQLYDREDENLEEVIYESVGKCIEETLLYLMDEDIYKSVTQPKYHLN